MAPDVVPISMEGLQDFNGLRLDYLHEVLLQACAMEQDKIKGVLLSVSDFSDTLDFLLRELNAWFSCFFYEDRTLLNNLAFSLIFQKDAFCCARSHASVQEICLLLRCCLITLHLLYMKNCDSVTSKCQVLVKILQDLCVSDRLRLPSNEQTTDMPASYISAACKRHLHCSLLEVFLDELTTHSHVKDIFRSVEPCFSTREKNNVAPLKFYNTSEMLELLCRHFILTINNEENFIKFLHSLLCSAENIHKVSQLSLETSMSLIRTLARHSTPLIIQAHLVMLVSKNIDVTSSPCSKKTNPVALISYVSAFDQSVNLYRYLLTSLQLSEDLNGMHSQLGFELCNQSYNSCIQPATYEKITNSMPHLVNFLEKHDSFLCKTKEETCISAIAYFNENRHVVEEPFRDQASKFLRSIVSVLTSYESGNPVLSLSRGNWQHIFCIAAVLKLMSNLLLQIELAFRNFGNTKNSSEYMFRKEYEFLSRIIYSFVLSCGNRLLPNVIPNLLQQNSACCDGIQVLMLHIVGLFLCSLDCGSEHIWKGCIAMMFPLLNLIILKDGNLDSLSSLDSLSKEVKDRPCRRSSFKIASNFRNIQTLYLPKPSSLLLCSDKKIKSIEREGESKNSNCNQENKEQIMDELHQCNGEEFLKIQGCKEVDIDDLADFIECVEGKDYSNYMRNKAKFRSWKLKRFAMTQNNIKYRR